MINNFKKCSIHIWNVSFLYWGYRSLKSLTHTNFPKEFLIITMSAGVKQFGNSAWKLMLHYSPFTSTNVKKRNSVAKSHGECSQRILNTNNLKNALISIFQNWLKCKCCLLNSSYQVYKITHYHFIISTVNTFLIKENMFHKNIATFLFL